MPLPYLCNIKSNEMYNLKNKTIMKALVLSVVFALTAVVNAVNRPHCEGIKLFR